MNGVASLAALSPENGLSCYLSEIRKFPLLTAAEEFAYAERWRELGDKDAEYKLVDKSSAAGSQDRDGAC
jgi:RNA polymerase sigma-32 factor